MNATVVGALIGGGVVLVGTAITGKFQLSQQRAAIAASRAERIAATADARAERIRHERLETYLGLINGTGRLMRWVELTAQTLTIEHQRAPTQLSEEEQWPLNARVNVLGSKEVGERLRRFNNCVHQFISEATILADITQRKNPEGLDLREHFASLRRLQDAAWALHGPLLEQIRLELGIDEAGDRITE